MSLNKDRRRLAYTNVKHFMNSRGQDLRFNLHHKLERKEELPKDVKLLETINYDTSKENPTASWVRIEKMGEEEEEASINFKSSAQFWNYVFSDQWRHCSVIRVGAGDLLIDLLKMLYHWAEEDRVKTYKIARFDRLEQPVRGGTMKRNEKRQETKTKPAKIIFTYYAHNESPDCGKSQIPSRAPITADPTSAGGEGETSESPLPDIITLAQSESSVPPRTTDPLFTVCEASEAPAVVMCPVNTHPDTDTDRDTMPVMETFPARKAFSCDPGNPLSSLLAPLHGNRGNRKLSKVSSRIFRETKKLPYRMLSDNKGYELTEEISWSEVKKLKLPSVPVTNSAAVFQTDLDQWRPPAEEVDADLLEVTREREALRMRLTRAAHPVMTDPSEHVIVSDEEDDEHEMTLSSPAQLRRTSHSNLEDYLRAQHRRLKTSRGRPHDLLDGAQGRSEESPPTPEPPQASREVASYRKTPKPPLSRYIFLRSTTAPEVMTRRNQSGEEPVYRDDHPDMCTCAEGLPRCKSSAEKNPVCEGDTVRSWCVPLSHEQKYRLDLLKQERPTIPVLQTSRLNPRHSVTRMRRIRRHNVIRHSIPETSPQRLALMEKLDAFLRTTFLPKLREMQRQEDARNGRNSVKLKVKRRHAGKRNRNRNKKRSNSPSPTRYNATSLFPRPALTGVHEANLRRALQEFVVRKEQVTVEEGWKTTTSITFNRKLHLTYGQPDAVIPHHPLHVAVTPNPPQEAVIPHHHSQEQQEAVNPNHQSTDAIAPHHQPQEAVTPNYPSLKAVTPPHHRSQDAVTSNHRLPEATTPPHHRSGRGEGTYDRLKIHD